MSTKLQIDGDPSGAKQALGSVAGDLGKVATAADATGQAIDKAMDADAAIAQVQAEVYELKRALDAAEASAKSANAQLEKANSAKASWTQLATAAGGIVTVAKAIAQGMQSARNEIRTLAENGSANFRELNNALDSVSDSWEDLKSNLADSSAGSTVTSLLTEAASLAGEAARQFDSLDEAAGAYYSGMAAGALEWVGLTGLAKKAREAQAEYTAELERSIEKENEQRKARQLAQVGESRAKLDESRAAQREADSIAQIKSEEEITAKIEEQFAALERLAKSGNLNSKARQDAERQVQVLERRRLDLLREQAAAEKEVADAAKRSAEEAARIREQYAESQAKKEAEATARAAEEQLAARRDAAEKAGRLPQELAEQEKNTLTTQPRPRRMPRASGNRRSIKLALTSTTISIRSRRKRKRLPIASPALMRRPHSDGSTLPSGRPMPSGRHRRSGSTISPRPMA